MRYWWVNHKQTFQQEFGGNYIWSPKTKRDGSFNRFYETMREAAPGDVVFSYAGGVIRGFGIARTHCYTSPRPNEFGHIGQVWDRLGWRGCELCTNHPDTSASRSYASLGSSFADRLQTSDGDRPRL